MTFRDRIRRLLRLPRRDRRRQSNTPSIPEISVPTNSEVREETEVYPLRWDSNRNVFINYIQLPRVNAFIRRVFLDDDSDYEEDYQLSGYADYDFTEKLLYIHEMMMVGILYIWHNFENIRIRYPQRALPTPPQYVYDERKVEEVVDRFFQELVSKEFVSVDLFIIFFHKFLTFYTSFRLQAKHSIFNGDGFMTDEAYIQDISEDIIEKWIYCIDLFWMMCLYKYNCKSLGDVMYMFQTLDEEIPFLIVFYLIIVLFVHYNRYFLGDPETLDKFERVLINMITQQNGLTGFEQMRPKVSSLETRLKQQFPEERPSEDKFNVVFIADLLKNYYEYSWLHYWYQETIQQSPSLFMSPSQSKSPSYLEDVIEKGLDPDRVGNTLLFNEFKSEPVSEEELVHYGLVTGDKGDVYKLDRDPYGTIKRVRVNRPTKISPIRSPSLSRSSSFSDLE